MNDDVLTRNTDGELAVRTVSSTESATVVNPNDVYTRDTDGKLCIRTVGGSGGGSAVKVNATITLVSADWSNNLQTVSVSGITSDGVVIVSPVPADQSAYVSAGILCTEQAEGTLTFTCDTVPSGDVDVNVVML